MSRGSFARRILRVLHQLMIKDRQFDSGFGSKFDSESDVAWELS
jgi:hypothetical protein